MILFSEATLPNGIKILVHEDHSTQLAALNLLYHVGARDEDPDRTGFAHLFEHLMFGGSRNVPDYDKIAQWLGAENNAFTTNDITNYYLTFPANNLEAALWLESDRLANLTMSKQSLEVQRSVVIEEFKQRYLNQPYGNVWHLLRNLCYKDHPYQWPTIGKDIRHIEEASLQEVRDFFSTFYIPNNLIISVTGNVKTRRVFELIEKWFGDIPMGKPVNKTFYQEPEQTTPRSHYHYADVPADLIVKAWRIPARSDEEYYAADLLSDILGRGKSARLQQELVKKQPIFSQVNAYVSGELDPGLLVVQGYLMPGVTMPEAERALEKEIRRLSQETVAEEELNKIKNQLESQKVFSETSILNIAMNLAYAKLLGDANMINTEIREYQRVSPEQLREVAARLLNPRRCNTLYYFAKEKQDDGSL